MMTVSNVINGTGKVSDQTRARVRQAIRNTGYVPNYEARRLASGGCSRIALLYSDQQTPFLAQVLLAAINASTAYGAQLLVRSSNSPTKRSTEKLVLNAARSGVQGLLLVPPLRRATRRKCGAFRNESNSNCGRRSIAEYEHCAN